MTNEPNWQLPKFYFEADFGDVGRIPFQEVSGLDAETQVIEYRVGDSRNWHTIKMPGGVGTETVTLRKGIIRNDNRIWTWFNQIQMNVIKRRTVTISLLDQEAQPTMIWTLANAWPAKISGTDLKASGTEIAVETSELVYEGLTIKSGRESQ